MKHLFKNVFMIIVILMSSVASGLQVTPAEALGSFDAVGFASYPANQIALSGMWGADANNIFAVGSGDSELIVYQTTDGSNWTASVPDLPETWLVGSFEGVWGVDANNVFAVGTGGPGTLSQKPLISFWDGMSWTSTKPGLPSASWTAGELAAVWGTSTSQVYAVGNGDGGTSFTDMPLVVRRDGSGWTSQALSLISLGYKHGFLRAIWGTADASHIYIAGRGVDAQSNNRPLLFHSTNGTSWSPITPPLPTGWNWGRLDSIWGTSNSDIYAVGTGGVSGSQTLPLLYHSTNGTTWTPVSPALPTINWTTGYLYGVWGAGSDVYAVGFGNNGQSGIEKTQPLVYRKTNNGWSASSYPPSGMDSGFYFGIWGSDADNVYAVGNAFEGNLSRPLIAHAGTDAVPPGAVTNLAAVTGPSAGSVRLTWTAPADDGPNPPDPNSGPVTSYLVKYSLNDDISTCDGADGSFADNGNLPVPVRPGTTQTMVVTGLAPSTPYYFSVCAVDDEGLPGEFVKTLESAMSRSLGPGAGKYDDTDLAWEFIGNFVKSKATGPYLGTYTQTKLVGSYAEFDFNGSVITLWYTKYTTMGKLAVYIDDETTPRATINQYSATRAWQAMWSSGNLGLSPGGHKVRLKHVGPTGKYVNIDAIQISGIPGDDIYDNVDPNLIYTRPFAAVTATGGPYNDTYSQSNAVGNAVTFWFTGSQIKLWYTKYTTMGKLAVYIDGNTIPAVTINQYGSRVWQATWASSDLGPGVHKVVLKHVGPSGKYVNIDAIEVLTYVPPPSSGPGTYDDRDVNWVYTGTFTKPPNVTGPHLGTYSQTNIVGSTAEFWFTGSQITIWYSKYTNMGNLAVYIDYSATPVATINQYGARVWQATWTSGDLGVGDHKVKLVHKGPSGKYVNIDAITIGSVPGEETYDNIEPRLTYTGTFSKVTATGPYGGSYHQTNVVGSTVEFWFSGSQVIFWYSKYTTMASVAVYIDNGTTPVATINQYGATRVWLATWASGDLGPGVHKIKLKNLGPSTKYMNIDAIQVRAYEPPPSMPPEKYDDTDPNWIYNTTFLSAKATGPYLGTYSQTSVVGNTAEFWFTGSQITLWYTKYTTMGKLAVYIDDGTTPVATINQYGAARLWQVAWTSGDLGAGNHKVILKHAGPSGKYVNIDAIQVSSAVPGEGIYDNTDFHLTHNGTFTSAVVSGSPGPSNGTWSYTSVVGNTVEFWFTGRQIKVLYSNYTNMGDLAVYLDGNTITPIATIHEYGATRVWQAAWTSQGDFGPGVHRVIFKHAGPSGKYVNIDSIEVFSTYTAP